MHPSPGPSSEIPTHEARAVGHTNAKLTTEVHRQVFDMGAGGVETLQTA
jgi:hypothetical protein